MSSNESSSSNVPQNPAPAGKPSGSFALLGVVLILLAALVWGMGPGRAKFEPAPLQKVALGCAQPAPDFVPSDATEVSGVDLSALTKEQANHVLYRLNMEPCPCGCKTSIAACRNSHPDCPLCKDLVQKIVNDERSAASGK